MTIRSYFALASTSAMCVTLLAHMALAQTAPDWQVLLRDRTHAPHATSTAISAEDLKTRLYIFADDSMQGRLLGQPGNVKATDYLAREARRIGLEPAGDNGTYFQTLPFVERRLADNRPLHLGETVLRLGEDVIIRDQGAGARSIDGAPVVFGGLWGDSSSLISPSAATGKLVVLATKPTESGGQSSPGIPNRGQVSAYFADAAGIAVIALDYVLPANRVAFLQPGIVLQDEHPVATPQYLYVSAAVGRLLIGTDVVLARPGASGRPITGNPAYRETPIANPARNVIGILRGSDPVLRNQFVAIGAHNDHIGTISPPIAHDSAYVIDHLFREHGVDDDRPSLSTENVARVNAILADIRTKTHGASARLDSINNGADDDGTGSVSVLELAEYFAGQHARPKRSLLFVWHVGEEEGLFGSQYFTDHPTVVRDSIVAQLNIDMIGRGDASDVTGTTKDGATIHGGPSYVQLVGSRRLSTELGDLAEKTNRDGKHDLTFDYSLDADGHPENIYCRSDHYSYARYGIPVIFFTTGGHADYHMVTDEPQYIDYEHMLRVVNLIKDVTLKVANLDHRVVVDKAKPDPRGVCRQ